MAAERESFQSLRPAGELARGTDAGHARARFAGTEVRHELPALAPRGVGEILDTGIDVLRARFLACVLLVAPLWLPVLALQAFAREMQSASDFFAFLLGLALTFCVQTLGIGLVTAIVYGEMQGRPATAREAIGVGLRRTPRLLLLTLISQPAVLAGTLCCIAPGIVLAWLWSVAPAALVLERVGPVRALSRSVALVRGGFWRWAGVVAVQTALVAPLSTFSGVIALPQIESWLRLHLGLSPGAYWALSLLSGALLSGVITAFSAVFLTVYYLHARVRAEGFDLTMRLERLRAREPRSPGGTVEGVA